MTPRKTVLLVEDDESVRHLVRLTLEMSGYDVVEATNGEEGLRQLDRHRPSAVVLDLMMPDLEGEGMLAWIRSRPATDRTPVVVITGKLDAADEMIDLVGRENFIPKPFDPETLIDRVNALLR